MHKMRYLRYPISFKSTYHYEPLFYQTSEKFNLISTLGTYSPRRVVQISWCWWRAILVTVDSPTSKTNSCPGSLLLQSFPPKNYKTTPKLPQCHWEQGQGAYSPGLWLDFSASEDFFSSLGSSEGKISSPSPQRNLAEVLQSFSAIEVRFLSTLQDPLAFGYFCSQTSHKPWDRTANPDENKGWGERKCYKNKRSSVIQ